MLIEVGGFDGKPLWIESRRVLGVKPYGKPLSIESSRVLGVKPLPPVMCAVIMACIDGSEEWKLCDNADSVRRAVDEANAPLSRPPAEDQEGAG